MKVQGRQKAYKSLKTKRKVSLPLHVKSSETQLAKMKSVIKNLLNPFVGRLHVFEAPPKKKTKRKS